MHTQDLETVATAETNEQLDARERQPYQAPSLVRLDLAETKAASPSIIDAGLFS